MTGKPVKCYVLHELYGCESGCDGHVVVVEDARGETERVGGFQFDAPYGADHQTWARDLAASLAPGVPFSWEDSRVSD